MKNFKWIVTFLLALCSVALLAGCDREEPGEVEGSGLSEESGFGQGEEGLAGRFESEGALPVGRTTLDEPAQELNPAKRGTTAQSRNFDAATREEIFGDADACPSFGADVEVRTVEAAQGAVIEFTTLDGDVTQLRSDVEHLAGSLHEHRGGGLLWRPAPQPDATAQQPRPTIEQLPSVEARVVPIERGARLILEPSDPGQLPVVRREARVVEQHLERGLCPS